MATKELLANIVINGKTTSGFNQLAAKLQTMGSQIEQIGGNVREFEEDSVNIYRGYEDNMLAAEFALSAQYKSATKLSQIMSGLNDAAQQWAMTTIFHTDDVSAAINKAAHAGWNYEQILTGIPQAMLIAQAGGMELNEGLNYLVKMMNTTSTEFENAGLVIDQWSKAANISATDIDELGQAFLSLGASAMFADSTQELFTLLAVLASAGTTGAKAGTLLRSAMMRLVAPTAKAMKAMQELGTTEEELTEWQQIYSEDGKTAQETLEKIGFSAYTASGELKPMMDIFNGLYDALQGKTEIEQYDILSAIFPLRSINAATAFMKAIKSGDMASIFEAIGDSEGYAASGAEIMMSGLTGAIETLISKWEEFQLKIGETLAPTVETWAEKLGKILDWLNNADEETISGLVGALNTLATLGPALLITGGAMKLFSTLGPVGTTFLLVAMGVNAAVSAFNKMKEIEFESTFGTMEVNLQELGKEIDSLDTKFTLQKKAIAEWEAALEEAEKKYADSATGMSEKMLMSVISGKKLTGKQKADLQEYAKDIVLAVNTGIANAEASDNSFLMALFGDASSVEEVSAYRTATAVVQAYYGNISEQAAAIGAELRTQLTAALQDDTLDNDEYKAVQATLDRYNQIMAQISAAVDSEAFYTQLYKAQNVSWDTAEDFVKGNQEKLDADLAAIEDAYAQKYGHFRAAYEFARESGMQLFTVGGQEYSVDTAWADFEAQLEREKQEARQQTIGKYNRVNSNMVSALLRGGGLEDEAAALERIMSLGIGNEGWDEGYSYEDYEALIAEINALRLSDSIPKLVEAGNRLGKYGITDGEEWSYAVSRLLGYENLLNDLLFQKDRNGEFDEVLEEGVAVPVTLDTSNVESQAAAIEVKTPVAVPATLYLTGSYITGGYIQGQFTGGGASSGPSENRNPFQIFANGGRATTASIFGEAGPEWAIPEEHTARTASLLNAARQASGFTWGDIISRFGGLNANAGNQNITLNYSPTINAADTQGITGALARDRESLKRLISDALRENRLRVEIASWA